MRVCIMFLRCEMCTCVVPKHPISRPSYCYLFHINTGMNELAGIYSNYGKLYKHLILFGNKARHLAIELYIYINFSMKKKLVYEKIST